MSDKPGVFTLTKRKKFILSASVLTVGLLATQWVPLDYRYVAIFGLFLLSYLISAWALFDDLKGIEWITILTLPAFFTAGVALFNYLLPEAFIAKLIVLVLNGVGLYAIFLTMNIFSVAAIRTIQLVRAAHAVGFLMSVLTLILLYNSIYSLHAAFYTNFVLVLFVSVPMMLQGLWSVHFERHLTKQLVLMSLGVGVLLALTGVMLSFLPVTIWIASLFLGTMVYVSLGLLQHGLSERLFSRTVYEYVGVGIFVLVATLLVTPWR